MAETLGAKLDHSTLGIREFSYDASARLQFWHQSAPNCVGNLYGQREFRALIVFGKRISGDRAREAALWTDSETIKINVARCLFRAPL